MTDSVDAWGYIGATRKPESSTLHLRRTAGHTLCGRQIVHWHQPRGRYAPGPRIETHGCRACYRIMYGREPEAT